jgi:hypothetical protein
LADIQAGKVEIIEVYKIDRLTRALSDFAKIVEIFDGKGVSFVSVTQQFNTTTSMGRLTLNALLSFAQFEREVTGERIRDASRCTSGASICISCPPRWLPCWAMISNRRHRRPRPAPIRPSSCPRRRSCGAPAWAWP